jgi:hypothetical protein
MKHKEKNDKPLQYLVLSLINSAVVMSSIWHCKGPSRCWTGFWARSRTIIFNVSSVISKYRKQCTITIGNKEIFFPRQETSEISNDYLRCIVSNIDISKKMHKNSRKERDILQSLTATFVIKMPGSNLRPGHPQYRQSCPWFSSIPPRTYRDVLVGHYRFRRRHSQHYPLIILTQSRSWNMA